MRKLALMSLYGISAATAAVACSSNNNSGGPSNTGDGGPTADSAVLLDSASDGPELFDVAVDAASADASDSSTDASSSSPLDASDGSQVATVGAAAVYTMSNAVTGNQVFGFTRAATGILTPMAAPFLTAGTGTGVSLGEQGAIALDAVNSRLYVVNAGDNSFSIFPVNADGTLGSALHVLADIDAATPALVGPKSVTFHGNTVYVLFEGNATTPSMVAGWTVTSPAGALSATPIGGSALGLTSGVQSVDPAEIAFSPDGTLVIVTEKQSGASGSISGSGSIDTFSVSPTGLLTKVGFYPTASAGPDAGLQTTPYGFAFYGPTLLVSEAGSQGLGAYTFVGGVVVPVLGATQFLATGVAPCWVTVSADWAYVANADGANLSGFTVSAAGGLTPIGAVSDAIVGTTGETVVVDGSTIVRGPTDETTTPDGKFLYVLNSAVPSIGVFSINGDGSLARVGAGDYAPAVGLPIGAVGIASR